MPNLELGAPKGHTAKLGINTSQFENWSKSRKQLQSWVSANMGFNMGFPGGAPVKRQKNPLLLMKLRDLVGIALIKIHLKFHVKNLIETDLFHYLLKN